jgi:hypothetical protein
VSIERRIIKLEERRRAGAPDACLICHPDGRRVARLYPRSPGQVAEEMPYEEYRRRWPQHAALKAYLAEPDGTCWIDHV